MNKRKKRNERKRRNHWQFNQLKIVAQTWRDKTRKRIGAASEKSSWWSFIPDWDKNSEFWIKDFCEGKHLFLPMIQYAFTDGAVRVWDYRDRLMIHLILKIIKPTFKHIISPLCLHLKGPSAIKSVTSRIKAALNTKRFNYCLRLDMKSYYASIDHRILLKQIKRHFFDPRILKYLEDIITIAVDAGGNVFLPEVGIPRQSVLSPFFGALYLTELDEAFTHRKGIFYLRFMDDVLILAENKRQYRRARRRLFQVLEALRLKLSPHKTRMGALKKGFHFLGVNFEVARTPQGKIQETKVDLHSRTCRRALDNIVALRKNAVNPAKIQRYLSRWATWWKSAIGDDKVKLLGGWVRYTTATDQKTEAWYGSGLLLGTIFYTRCFVRFDQSMIRNSSYLELTTA